MAFVAPCLVMAQTPSSGTVVYVDGTVTANGRVVDIGDKLDGTVTLKTEANGQLEVVFDGKNVFRLGPSTVLKVDFAQVKKTVTLDKGTFTSVLKKLNQAVGASFVLRTPTVTAGVRGTSFHVSTDGTRTYFCTCNGSVDLADPTGAQALTLTNAHHGARIYTKKADGTVVVEAGGLEGHTDASIETLARRIAFTVDWSKPDLSAH